MPLLFPLTSFLFQLPFLGRLFQFVIPVANYVERRDLPHEVRYAETVLDTFDMLAPAFDRPITPEELTARLSDLVGDIELVSRAPVIARGRRV
jgi:hypothetical protein